jgi:type VI protein secretion system component VasK
VWAVIYDVVPLLAPLVWAGVSVCVALVLYKTSGSFFEREGGESGGKIRLRLTGSIVIAACVFFALWKVTPEAALDTAHQRDAQNLNRKLGEVANLVTDARAQSAELQACIGEMDPSDCKQMAETLDRQIRQIGQLATTAAEDHR